ncbi:MAG: hypothetical protein NVV62_06910 [Terricaulis sp.]|nr:hypothetical protein [Terricaulis sp.]
MKHIALGFALVFALALLPQRAHAQIQPQTPEARALATCLVSSVSEEDNITLVRWLFIAMARHPSVSGLTAIPDTERVNANRRVATLFNRLLMEACPVQARAAFVADGENALYTPFGVLGEKATEGIVAHPDVNAAVAEMASYLDQAGLAALME